MRVIIAGSRDITDADLVELAILQSGFEITTLICGCASGADTLGKQWARRNSIPVIDYPADWKKHGKAAGPIRNTQMAIAAEALIAVTNGSRGTQNMIDTARAYGLKVFVKHEKKRDQA